MAFRLFPLFLALIAAASGASAQSAQNYNTVPVQESRVQSHLVLGGTVVPKRQVTVSAQLPGRVEFLAGAEGDSFEDGARLVALDDDELLAKRAQVLAQVSQADSALRNAGVQFTRELVNPYSANQMPGMGMPSMFDTFFTRGFSNMMGVNNSGMDRHAALVQRGSGISQARSAFMQAQAQLQEVDAKLNDTVGKAPFDGVIIAKMVEVGDTVQPGQPLMRYADTKNLQVEVEVPSRLMLAIREGDVVPTRLDVHNLPVQARVARIFPMANPQRHTVTVKFDLPGDAPAAPGMYAEVMVTDPNASDRGAPVVPMRSLIRRGSLPAVFVVNNEGETELRLVRLGEQVSPTHVSVLSGLRVGERIVASPTPGMQSTASN